MGVFLVDMDSPWERRWQQSVSHYDEAGEDLLRSYIEQYPDFRRPSKEVGFDSVPRSWLV